MESKKDIWIEKTLHSLEGLEPAFPSGNMHARIMQRLQGEKFRIIPDTVSAATIYRAAAAILLVMALNVFTCLTYSKSMTEKKGLQSFAKEYSLPGTSENLINI